MLVGAYTELGLGRVGLRSARARPGLAPQQRRPHARPESAARRGAARLADGELPRRRHRRQLMRLFRRNAIGFYAVYAAAMVSGLVVTPILLTVDRRRGVRDLGVHRRDHDLPGRARHRRSDRRSSASRPRRTDAAIRRRSTASPRSPSSSTRRSACSRSSPAPSLAWCVPLLIETPPDLVWDGADLDIPRHALTRGPLSARPLLQPARRPPPLRPAEPRQLRRDGALRGSRRDC